VSAEHPQSGLVSLARSRRRPRSAPRACRFDCVAELLAAHFLKDRCPLTFHHDLTAFGRALYMMPVPKSRLHALFPSVFAKILLVWSRSLTNHLEIDRPSLNPVHVPARRPQPPNCPGWANSQPRSWFRDTVSFLTGPETVGLRACRKDSVRTGRQIPGSFRPAYIAHGWHDAINASIVSCDGPQIVYIRFDPR
jgi:hypothetical protein